MKYLYYYLFFINVLVFFLMGIDKRKAELGRWRIPERTLFLSAFLGGGVGAIAGMQLFRHKTKHRSFTVGMPLILLLWIIGLSFLLYVRYTHP